MTGTGRAEGRCIYGQAGKVEDRCTDRALNPLCSKQQVRCTRTAICKSPRAWWSLYLSFSLFLYLHLSFFRRLKIIMSKTTSNNGARDSFPALSPASWISRFLPNSGRLGMGLDWPARLLDTWIGIGIAERDGCLMTVISNGSSLSLDWVKVPRVGQTKTRLLN